MPDSVIASASATVPVSTDVRASAAMPTNAKGDSSTGSDVDFDVVVIGGAFAGASVATLLRRSRPDCRVLVVESAQRFDRKVGEATVEVSGLFLHRVLGLYDHLSRHHLPKHGLRYWLSDGPGRRLSEMSEIGSSQVPRLPSFQLDRSVLDEHLLKVAADEGCTVLRPAKILDVDHDWPTSRVQLEDASGPKQVTTRWVVDASGRHAFLARRMRLRQRVEEHPTAAVWGRWQGVKDLDSASFQRRDENSEGLAPVVASRRLATNHFCGYGWWCWVIPLAGGQTSIGLVYDKRLFQVPGDGPLRQRYEAFVRQCSGLAELLADAELDCEDFMSYSHLPYKTSRYIDRGWALVGDAASFMDPYYSPGLDHAAISTFATARLIARDLAGDFDEAALTANVTQHNDDFLRSYDRWLQALYIGKYELMGDAELLASSFLVDTALYYLGVVTPIYKDEALTSLANPVFGLALPQAKIAFLLTRAFNRRLQVLARHRLQVGTYGRANMGQNRGLKPFALGPAAALRPLLQGLRIWLRMEVERGWHLLRHGSGAPSVNEAAPASSSSR